MKIRKNFEAFFLAAVALALSATYAGAKVPALHAKASQSVAAEFDGKVHTVVVKAERLSAAEKAALN